MNLNELLEIALQEMLEKNREIKTKIGIENNNRSYACICYKKKMIYIPNNYLNKNHYKCYSRKELIDVIKHELVHLWLYENSHPTYHNTLFRSICDEVGASKYRLHVKKHKIIGKLVCNCGYEYKYRRKLKNSLFYRCPYCGNTLDWR